MYRTKKFGSVLEAIKYMKLNSISNKQLVYIASKGNKCELVYRP